MKTELQIPDEVTVTVDGLDARVEGPNGAVERRLWYPDVSVHVDDDTVVIESDQENRETKATVGTFESHLQNAFHGDTEVEVDDPVVTIRGPDKEHVGQTAGNIRESTRVPGKDTRVFEDGIYVTEAPGGEVTG